MLILYVKALHFVFVVAWFAGLFYLPRLFVYHAQSTDDATSKLFATMERRLYRGIMLPSSMLALIFGLWLTVANWGLFVASGWFWSKIVVVVLLFAYHGYCGRLMKSFALGENSYSHVFYRWFNELPLVALIAIAILVIAKPF